MIGEPKLPRTAGWLRPLVDAVARIDLNIHRKLLFGFLAGAFLLVAMAVLSLVVIARMDQRMDLLNAQALKVSRAQQMLYDVTAQSHYRAMALLTHRDDPEAADWNDKILDKKKDFVEVLHRLQREDPADADFYRRLDAANQDYAQASATVLAAYRNENWKAAKRLHLTEEHVKSHVIEDLLANCDQPSAETACVGDRPFVDTAIGQMVQAREAFRSDRALVEKIVIAFSALSVLVALLLGFALSWAFILPVKKMQGAFAALTAGHFDQRVDVPNRDEFGALTHDLNSTSERLAELFDTQRSLARRLSETNASLARASEAKSRFLASVSHELRTPMNAILGFTDALLAGVDGPLNAEQQESLEWVQRGGRDLLGLINEILDLSKIEAGRLTLDPQPFDPRELVESVVAQHRSLAAQKGLRFGWRDAGAPAQVVLDQQRVRQILVNLCGNALKFTSEGEVAVELSGASDDTFRVAVRDSGPGIEADQHEAIFEEFRQADTGEVGTGLGLTICRRLARAMAGDVTLESELGRGSVFHLRLPLDCRAAPAEVAPGAENAPTAGPLVLSVDDDPSVAPLLQKMLTGHGYRVVASKSPSAVVSDARRLQPAAILLDLLMPERDGADVLTELKADAVTSNIPVIVVSVVDAADVPDLADGQLSKPLHKPALLSVLAEHTTSKMRL